MLSVCTKCQELKGASINTCNYLARAIKIIIEARFYLALNYVCCGRKGTLYTFTSPPGVHSSPKSAGMAQKREQSTYCSVLHAREIWAAICDRGPLCSLSQFSSIPLVLSWLPDFNLSIQNKNMGIFPQLFAAVCLQL